MTQPKNPGDAQNLAETPAETRAETLRAIESGNVQDIEAAAARLRADLRRNREDAGVESAVDALPPELVGHLFGSAANSLELLGPELQARLQSGPRVGLCLSGGGTRAASCSMGALRALSNLGLLEQVDFLSTVSGGSWAGSIYQYSPFDLADSLGPNLPTDAVGSLTWSSGQTPFNLGVLSDQAIGHFCTRIGFEELISGAISLYLNYGDRISGHLYWPRLIGEYVLRPYDLGDRLDTNGDPTRYFSAQRAWFDLVAGKNNPELSPGAFYFARDDRPWWVANATMSAPDSQPEPYPFWHSDLAVGVFPPFAGQGIGNKDLGGGAIDPFTFGSQSPVSTTSDLFTVETPSAQFALSDAVGTSSAALSVELFARLPGWLRSILGDLTPEYPYWPVMNPRQSAETYEFSDGASLDNTGVCGLLGYAGVDNIISIVSTPTPITVENNNVRMDSTVPALFGLIWDPTLGRYRSIGPQDGNAFFVHAFDSADFNMLAENLRRAISGGGAGVAKVKTTTVHNPRFGIRAGQQIEILFVFNFRALNFWNALELEIKLGLDFYYPLVTFPYFSTTIDLNLIPQAVNLLADQMAWSMETNADTVRSLFDTVIRPVAVEA